MRVLFSNLQLPGLLPRNPVLRALLLIVGALILAGLLFFGLLAGVALLAFGAVVLLVRRLFPHKPSGRRKDDGIIEGEFSVVDPRPRGSLPRVENP